MPFLKLWMKPLVNNNTILEILYDHYRDSVSIVKKDIKARQKYFQNSILFLFFQFLLIFYSSQVVDFINGILKSKLNFDSSLGYEAVSVLLHAMLLIHLMKYFQLNVSINRQYSYLHEIENKINKFRNDFITREGKSYLNNYPLFSNFIDVFYTTIFPLLVIFISCTILIKNLINQHFSLDLLLLVEASFSIFVIVLCGSYCFFYKTEVHRKIKNPLF